MRDSKPGRNNRLLRVNWSWVNIQSEVFGFRKDGVEFPAEITISTWKVKEGTFSTAIVRDITERKRAEKEMQKRLKELEVMYRVSTVLRTIPVLETMLPRLLEEALAMVETDTGAIWLFDPGTSTLRRAVARGWLAEMENTVSKPGEGFPGIVFSANQVSLSDEFARDPKFQSAGAALPLGWGGACIPIRSEKETVGVICIALKLPRKISPDEVNLWGTLSEMTGTAIQRSRLSEQTANQLDHLSALHAIDTAINASMDLNVTLSYFLDQVMSQLRVDAADVLLCDPHMMTLEYIAGRGFRGSAITATRIRVGEGQAGRAAIERRLIHVANIKMNRSRSRNGCRARDLFPIRSFH